MFKVTEARERERERERERVREGGERGRRKGAKACKVQYKTTVTDVEENKKRK